MPMRNNFTASSIVWPVPRNRGPLLADEVRVWRVSLDLEAQSVNRLAGLLSDDELNRAARFYFRRDAIRFVVSRAALRTGLAECLGVEPHAVGLQYGAHGKPELAAPFDQVGLQFNASRSASLAIYAVTRQRRVGVDIERLRPLPDLDAIAEHVFSPRPVLPLGRPGREARIRFICGGAIRGSRTSGDREEDPGGGAPVAALPTSSP